MHFVAALDEVPGMRGILALFEGVATGAADGYARIAGKPAATLLHLGPGLGNGLANLHNARRGHVPVVNIVGDHATLHHQYDAPLQSDIAAIASSLEGWVRTSSSPETVATDAADAVAAALTPPGQIATMILPADVCWLATSDRSAVGAVSSQVAPGRTSVTDEVVEAIAKVLRSGEPAAIIVGGSVVASERGLVAATMVAAASDAKLICETFPTRLVRGAGLPQIDRLSYLGEFAQMQMGELKHLVIVDSRAPVSFFAYPGKASDLTPDGCAVHVLAGGADDAVAALIDLGELLGANRDVVRQAAVRPDRPTGALKADTLAAAIGAVLPEGAIVADEGNTSGLFVSGATAGCPRHDWLTLTGGAIGYGMPVATGAATAAPDRKVLNLESDGSAMYTFQALWTQAREGLDVTTVILNNRSYAILNMELTRVGAVPGPQALRMLDLTGPQLDFVALAKGMGVPATRATTAEEFTVQLERAMAEPGPALIDAVLPSSL